MGARPIATTPLRLASQATAAGLSVSVTTLAALKALSTRPNSVTTQCRTTAGDGGGGTWVFRTGDQSANVTADSRSALWAAPDTASTGASGAWQRQFNYWMMWPWFGVTGDGVVDNSTAFDAAMSLLTASADYGLFITEGNFLISGQKLIDCAAVFQQGIHIDGAGQYAARLTFTSTADPAFRLYCSGGSSVATQVNLYYSSIKNVAFAFDTPNVGFELGLRNLYSAIGSSQFENLVISNNNATEAAAGTTIRINQMFECGMKNVVASGRATLLDSWGKCLVITQATFNVFEQCAFSNAQYAITTTHDGDSTNLGFIYSNTFIGLDMENYEFGWFNDSPNISRNLVVAPLMFSYYNTGYDIKSTATAGTPPGVSAVTFDTYYFSGGNGLDPGNLVGISLRGALGTAANYNTSTSGANVPLMNGANTWSGVQTFNGTAPVDITGSTDGDVSYRLYNASTGASATTTFQQNSGGRYVLRTLYYTSQLLQEIGVNITQRESSFDAHTFRLTNQTLVGTIDSAGLKLESTYRLDLQNSQSTVGAAGAASALPANPTGYVPLKVAGTEYVVPYYAKT